MTISNYYIIHSRHLAHFDSLTERALRTRRQIRGKSKYIKEAAFSRHTPIHFENITYIFQTWNVYYLPAYRAPFRGFFTLTGILILGEILVQWWHLWAGGLVCMTICVYNTTNVRQAAKLGQCSAHSSCLAKKQNATMKQINNPCL